MKWTKESYHAFWKELKRTQDLDYITFSKKLIFTKYEMLGIRTPILRKKATEIAKQDIISYLAVSSTASYEEVMMQGFVIGKIQEKEILKDAFLSFVPLIDNWAICDMVIASLKGIKKEKSYFLEMIDNLLARDAVFAVRSGFVLLLNYYVEKDFLPQIFDRVLRVDREEYYIEMAKAWLLCECFLVEEKATFSLLETAPLSFSLFSKTIQKICDSRRVSKERKEQLKALKQKRKELYS